MGSLCLNCFASYSLYASGLRPCPSGHCSCRSERRSAPLRACTGYRRPKERTTSEDDRGQVSQVKRWSAKPRASLVLDILKGHAPKGEGYSQVLVVAIGFVADHLEILYDIDLEAQEKARELGLTLRRTESLNTDPELVEGLAEEVLQATASLTR